MNKQQIATLALGALMLAPILAAPVMREPSASVASRMTWRAVAVTPDGESWIVEHGVTAADCRDFESGWYAGRHDAPIHCERE